MNKVLCVIIISLVLLVDCQAGVTRVYAIPGTVRVLQGSMNNSLRTNAGNKVWDGFKVNLFGGRNEIVMFQLVTESTSGATSVNVSLASLSNGTTTIQNGAGANDTTWAGHYIDWYVEQYVHIPHRSHFPSAGGIGPIQASAQPDSDQVGYVPDPLIPKSATSNGAPLNITAGNNQSWWCNVYIPRTATTGTYTGTVIVSESGTTTYSIPITLQVYNFTLSDTMHSHTFGYLDRETIVNCLSGGLTESNAAFWVWYDRWVKLGRRFGLTFIGGVHDSTQYKTNVEKYYTGSAFSSDYEGPGASTGLNSYYIAPYKFGNRGNYDTTNNSYVGSKPYTQAKVAANMNFWAWRFKTYAPNTLVSLYMIDEYDQSDGVQIATQDSVGDWTRNATSAIHRIYSFSTKEFMYSPLYNHVDFWVIGAEPSLRLTDVAVRRPYGDLFGIYGACRPYFGTAMDQIDTKVCDATANMLIAWKYGLSNVFQWTTAFYGEDVGAGYDPYVRPWMLNASGDTTFGEGQLVYPGMNTEHPETNHGIRNLFPSIRMLTWGQGVTCYEYLWLAKQQGNDSASVLLPIVNAVVPRALTDWGGSYLQSNSHNKSIHNVPSMAGDGEAQPPAFSQNGFDYESLRYALANVLDPAQGTVPNPYVNPGTYISGSKRHVMLNRK